MNQETMTGQQNTYTARRIAESLRNGLIIVDADGDIVWTDEQLRHRLNGELNKVSLPLDRSDEEVQRAVLDGFIATLEVDVAGETQQVCVIQEVPPEQAAMRHMQRIVDAVEELLAEPSWLTATLMDKLKARLQSAGPSSRAADLKRLTAREREILGLVCEGCTDAQMARILKLSQNTVRNHLASLFRKIGVNRRSAAVIWARERAITKHDTLDSTTLRDRAAANDGG